MFGYFQSNFNYTVSSIDKYKDKVIILQMSQGKLSRLYHLKAKDARDREEWYEALVESRNVFQFSLSNFRRLMRMLRILQVEKYQTQLNNSRSLVIL